MAKLLIVGSTSGIAQALARHFAGRGDTLALAGRRPDAVRAQAAELAATYGASVAAYPFEAQAFDTHGPLLRQVVSDLGGLDGVIVCHGYLGDQQPGQQHLEEARLTFEINTLSYISLLDAAAAYFEPLGRGFLCALSSVAGDRGKRSNYVYGASKAALTVYLQGLRHRLAPRGVRVLTVKPGFVDTRMTQGMTTGIPAAKPEGVARSIARAIARRRNTVYVPGYWRWLMGALRCLPDSLFNKLSI